MGTETFDSITTSYYRGGAVSPSTSVYCSCVRNGLCGGCPGYHRGVRHIHATELQPAHKVDQLRTDCECSVCMIIIFISWCIL